MGREASVDVSTKQSQHNVTPGEIKDLSLEDLLEKKLTGTLEGVDTGLEINCGLFHDVISIVERILIKIALRKTNSVQVAAAQFLGINRNTIRKKIKDLKIEMP